MTENAQLEAERMENTHHGKCQNGNSTPLKIKEKSHPRKGQKNKIWIMPGWKLHTLEIPEWKMHIAQPGKYQNGNCTPWKMTKITPQKMKKI